MTDHDLDVRHAIAPDQLPLFDTTDLRDRFVVTDLFADGEVRLCYSMADRLVIGGVVPGGKTLELPVPDELRAENFCDRREVGVVNIGEGEATVSCDGEEFKLTNQEVLYISRGTRKVTFAGDTRLYLVSAPAHAEHPTVKVTKDEAAPVALGDIKNSNERTIYKYIHDEGAKSCQLVMGVTVLAEGSMWNTMPAHVHARRSEIYLYFNLPEDHRVVHLMGEPEETRHVILANEDAVISPPWSIHAGMGTAAYTFVWAMAGENTDYADCEQQPITSLR
ncbi:5-dehydro-4-deoxy-D-glucuronate isomerase [Enemella dayhoffiae]|uniref:4-deoxy-L-threo-5-hexosulose-uronate ketol-isomerase n=1 Tax=Enemella dayhoffiae TaxID=2016507 RepID=A0A255GS71_9ACTN|nr:5-dehydro-4-deoxy-D-glucuronate isomerase [Enemella dayhoffiae]OYO18669.1 5-dehydro-4-deoxy-D-glucuronate isomerase [Enemella dayhoffiae]